MRGLSGKTAIVTGAGSGIGREVAIKLARSGVSVGLLDINAEGLKSTAHLIREMNGQVDIITGNVSNRALVKSAVEHFNTAFESPITIGINCAGFLRDSKFIDMTDEDWDAVMNCHLTGTFIFTQVVSKSMIDAGVEGSIVNIGSVLGKSGGPGRANYAAAKAGITSFSKTVARELAAKGIRCNTVAPGLISTALFEKVPKVDVDNVIKKIPLSRIGTAEEVASMCCFLASEESSYVTGSELIIDGGLIM